LELDSAIGSIFAQCQVRRNAAWIIRLTKWDPPPASIHWREIESLLKHLGATVDPSHGARYKVSLHRASEFIHHPHHNSDCSRDLIKQVREFLAHAGVSPSAYEAAKNTH
jgi:hypothetical protein